MRTGGASLEPKPTDGEPASHMAQTHAANPPAPYSKMTAVCPNGDPALDDPGPPAGGHNLGPSLQSVGPSLGCEAPGNRRYARWSRQDSLDVATDEEEAGAPRRG
ncbi:hypothetical protein ANANG_G00198010 [Anguilla anguilla]|uniref:Uncharacterized protein n=1 Tax=Anguilla anguilla TaxID=7936 RepID=A0A9D3M2C5_ANGAN|nr:hypothetical protein ANANG_G00198010 [Anguilla anguilla]